jgi:hypothetical protein
VLFLREKTENKITKYEKIIKNTKKYCFKDSEKINKELPRSCVGTQEKIGRKNRKIFIKQQFI